MTDEAPTAAEVQALIAALEAAYPVDEDGRLPLCRQAAAALAALTAERDEAQHWRGDFMLACEQRDKAEAALAERDKLIAEHNRGIEEVCGANNDYNAKRNGCDSYLPRGRQCPDCPREWRIDAALATKEKP